MSTKYNPAEVEPKWQKYWLDHGTFKAENGSAKPKKYVLVEFPYPSGAGLHMGHVRPFTAGDVLSRYYRHTGYEVVYPFGWDAFGLPAENYAIKMGVQPEVSTAQNIANAKRQVVSWGVSFDWSREINTTDPAYYKWTQWLFLKFYEAGLAYQATAMLNWCPKDKTVLANEEVINGCCERCGTVVEQREMRQWFLKITDYAQKLLDGLENLDWPTAVKTQQVNWIGKSEGVTYTQKIKDLGIEVEAYDSVPQTFKAQTFAVIAPEHPLLKKLVTGTEFEKTVLEFVDEFKVRKAADRFNADTEIEGIFTGRYIQDPFGDGDLPLWVATFVIVDYGTGIVNCSAHDERDFVFAKKYGIPLRVAMLPSDLALAEQVANFEICYHHAPDGILQAPEEFKGQTWAEARSGIIDYIESHKLGRRSVNFKLRDWVFSRQRYWGEPIPIIHCEKCGTVPVPVDQLPVVLPKVDHYEPTGTGESPLAAIPEWVNVPCPKCGGPAKRETDTMPQWAGSSWYFLRYCDPHNDKAFASPESLKYWMPVDLYFGGMEHTTLHLLYSRFWNLFLHDQGLVPVSEPYKARVPHGIILAHDGEKMSKSRGNVVNPDDIVSQYGADTMRMFELFLGPHDQAVAWSDRGIVGVSRFLDRVWKFVHSQSVGYASAEASAKADESVDVAINKLVKKITEDVAATKFNTAVSAFMEFINTAEGKTANRHTLESFLVLLSPFAPHITEELWQLLGNRESIALAPWPTFDASKITEAMLHVAVQVNGKLRGALEVDAGSATQEKIETFARELSNVKAAIAGGEVAKVIFVPNRLINFVLKPMV